jgi:hypothetical protein
MINTIGPNEAPPSEITFEYVNPDHINDCYVSGFFGGIAPSRKIHCHFFSERPAIPAAETVEIMSDGKLGKRLRLDRQADFVRLIQSSIVFDLHTAKEMIQWLQHQVERLESPNQDDKA